MTWSSITTILLWASHIFTWWWQIQEGGMCCKWWHQITTLTRMYVLVMGTTRIIGSHTQRIYYTERWQPDKFNNLGGIVLQAGESVKQTSSFQGARVRESGSYTWDYFSKRRHTAGRRLSIRNKFDDFLIWLWCWKEERVSQGCIGLTRKQFGRRQTDTWGPILGWSVTWSYGQDWPVMCRIEELSQGQ